MDFKTGDLVVFDPTILKEPSWVIWLSQAGLSGLEVFRVLKAQDTSSFVTIGLSENPARNWMSSRVYLVPYKQLSLGDYL